MKKLTLAKENLAQLAADQLEAVVAGDGPTISTCGVSAMWCTWPCTV